MNETRIEMKIICPTCKKENVQTILELTLRFSEDNTQMIPKTIISGWFGNTKCTYCDTIYSIHIEAYRDFER